MLHYALNKTYFLLLTYDYMLLQLTKFSYTSYLTHDFVTFELGKDLNLARLDFPFFKDGAR